MPETMVHHQNSGSNNLLATALVDEIALR